MRPVHIVALFVLVMCSAPPSLKAQTSEDWAAAARAIRRLPPSSFAKLPYAVRQAVERRGCTIPQTYFSGPPHNVVRGAFARPAQHGWAILCSREGRSSILVFSGGGLNTAPAELASAEDAHFLQTIGDNKIGYSRGISRAASDQIRHYALEFEGPLPKRLDHDGIDDAFIGKGSRILYYEDGEWRELAGRD